ncbi:hypothetical protein [Bradyrhizobium sp. LB5.2]|uniref:hypothetical protein n=1 Tax=Bradyrhizobium sp. LB5.2 TaxID=3156329 RepID=UPI00339B5BDB
MPAAFIVDGLTEKKIVQRVCQGSTVRTTGLNGKNVALDAIAKVVHSFIRLFKDRHYPVIVVIDREGRVETSELIEAELTRLLVSMGVRECDIIVSCPDRMIENWMLGDVRYFDEIYDLKLVKPFEGLNGKTEIRRLLREKDIAYHETTVGVDIFTQADPTIVAANSASFARLGARCIEFCHWVRRRQAQ